jgi:fibronectin-binding autotransporter adhesin
VGASLTGTGATITFNGAGSNIVDADSIVEDAHIVLTNGATLDVYGVTDSGGGTNGGKLQLNASGAGLELNGTAGNTINLGSDTTSTTAARLILKGDVTTSGTGLHTIASVGNGTTKGIVDLNSGTRTFTVADTASGTDLAISAVITSGALAKAGSGTLSLSGNNSYTGTTNLTAGTLLVNGNQTASTGAVTVASGATLGGTGALGGATTIAGILAPGDGGIGTLNIASNVTWQGSAIAGASTDWIFNLGASSTADLLHITGDFLRDSSAGNIFRFNFNGATTAGTFKLVEWSGSSSFTSGNFTSTNLGSGFVGSFNLHDKQLDFTLSAIPEPSTWIAMAALVFGGVLIIHRRRKA